MRTVQSLRQLVSTAKTFRQLVTTVRCFGTSSSSVSAPEIRVTNPYDVKGIANIYEEHRAKYPAEVFQNIRDFCQDAGTDFSLAVDIACGPGLATVPLSKMFQQVVGVDVSADMMAQAPRVSNIMYREANCNQPLDFLATNSVDLVNVSTAIHWLDKDRFFSEADRLLKPGACLSVMSLLGPGLYRSEPEVERLIKELSVGADEHEPYPSCVESLHNGFKDFSLPYPGWTRFPEVYREVRHTAASFFQYFSTIHTYHDYMQNHPEHMGKIKQAFKEWQEGEENKTFLLKIPTILFMGQKPRH